MGKAEDDARTGETGGPSRPASTKAARGADGGVKTARVLGAVLAGGRGSRLGGEKAIVDLAGRPLISHPLDALASAGLAAFVVAKPTTELGVRPLPSYAVQKTNAPPGSELELVTEPEEPRHPLVGIISALRHAERPVVVVGCDFPFVPPALLRLLAEAPEPLVVPAPGGRPQPLVARWTPALLPQLEAALAHEEPLRRTVADLRPRLLEDADLAPFGDPVQAFFNVNTPDDLERARAIAPRPADLSPRAAGSRSPSRPR